MDTKNIFDHKVNTSLSEYEYTANLERLQAKFKDKPLHVRLSQVRTWINIFSYVANFVSFLTCFAFVAYFLNQSLSDYFGSPGALAVSIGVGLFCSLAVEKFKRSANESFFLSLFRYRTFSLFSFSALIVLSGLSISASYLGAKQLPKIASKAPEQAKPNLTSIDAIKGEYQANIEQLRTDKKEFFNTFNYKNKLSSKYQKEYSDFDVRIKNQQFAMDQAVKAATEQNRKLTDGATKAHLAQLKKHESNLDLNILYITCIVLFFESFLIFSILFSNWIDFRTYLLYFDSKQPVSNSSTTSSNTDKSGNSSQINNDKQTNQVPTNDSLSSTIAEGAKLLLANKKKLLSTYQKRLTDAKSGNEKRDKSKLESHVQTLSNEIDQINNLLRANRSI